MGSNGERLLRVDQVVRRIEKSPETVRRWAREGKIEAFRAGRPWLIPESAVEAFRNEGTENS